MQEITKKSAKQREEKQRHRKRQREVEREREADIYIYIYIYIYRERERERERERKPSSGPTTINRDRTCTSMRHPSPCRDKTRHLTASTKIDASGTVTFMLA